MRRDQKLAGVIWIGIAAILISNMAIGLNVTPTPISTPIFPSPTPGITPTPFPTPKTTPTPVPTPTPTPPPCEPKCLKFTTCPDGTRNCIIARSASCDISFNPEPDCNNECWDCSATNVDGCCIEYIKVDCTTREPIVPPFVTVPGIDNCKPDPTPTPSPTPYPTPHPTPPPPPTPTPSPSPTPTPCAGCTNKQPDGSCKCASLQGKQPESGSVNVVVELQEADEGCGEVVVKVWKGYTGFAGAVRCKRFFVSCVKDSNGVSSWKQTDEKCD